MDKVITPFEYGEKAFHNGIVCVPALDKEFLEVYMKGLQVGEGIPFLEEWARGWHEANRKAPVQD